MKDNMIEAKLDLFRKLQDDITAVGFKIQHSDIPDYLAAAALGKRYYLVLVDADHYDESEGVVREGIEGSPACGEAGQLVKSIAEKTEGDNVQNNTINQKQEVVDGSSIPQTEGDKLRVRAVMMCKDGEFQDYCFDVLGVCRENYSYFIEEGAVQEIYDHCNIKSRSELTTNVEAQKLFLELIDKFNNWKNEQIYEDNLSRPG